MAQSRPFKGLINYYKFQTLYISSQNNISFILLFIISNSLILRLPASSGVRSEIAYMNLQYELMPDIAGRLSSTARSYTISRSQTYFSISVPFIGFLMAFFQAIRTSYSRALSKGANYYLRFNIISQTISQSCVQIKLSLWIVD